MVMLELVQAVDLRVHLLLLLGDELLLLLLLLHFRMHGDWGVIGDLGLSPRDGALLRVLLLLCRGLLLLLLLLLRLPPAASSLAPALLFV